jgi:hypothetical protein
MGEKGNLLDMGGEIFANLAEQGPQFWLDYKQYKLSRAKSVQARTVVEQQAAVMERDAVAQDPPANSTGRPPGSPSRRPGRWPTKAARCWPCSAAAIAV